MKYIIDLDSLKKCFELLPNPFIHDGKACVYLNAVNEMIDIFPKEKINDDTPTEVVNHGDWVFWGGWCGNHDRRIEDATCSECGYKHPTVRWEKGDVNNESVLNKLAHKCPRCGAKMGYRET